MFRSNNIVIDGGEVVFELKLNSFRVRRLFCSMKLNFRDAHLNDLPGIVSIYNATIPGRMVTADLEPVSVKSRMDWFYEHTPERRPLWVIEDDQSEMLGWVSFQDFYGRIAYIATAEISIYIDAAHQRKGIGKQALQYAMDQCAGLQIKTLLGFIFAHNEPSLQLFYQLGFEDWAMLPNIANLDGIERSLKIVGKRVSD
ncbi:GNAT family N-acetyltransferase [Chitinophagaceae bacterium LB-8]|uniref:GNAT family N-acetyltransferase n=1 Tax=Paraflavisolibacter caeni TaxID=2982496 RepID=A0A9X2XXJ6_9BACT|nr:GNAT family N-acetyltransferase [Paraflavisolibacter caeni]MCU7550527.1 GNAT family N-acetyltransferase [Paraflavisolibacter caeni]